MAPTTRRLGPDPIGSAAALSDAELAGRLDKLFCEKAAVEGAIVVLLGEVERRQSYRAEGATGAVPWAAERFGVATASARALVTLAERAWDLPHLVGALCDGEVSFDQVRAVAPSASPERDEALAEAAKGTSSVRELAEVARRDAATDPTSQDQASLVPAGPRRASVRFNEACHTMVAQLPPVLFAEARATLEARAALLPSEGETPFDERLGEALATLVRAAGSTTTTTSSPATTTSSPSPVFVVAHVALSALVSDQGEASDVAAELERGGYLDTETLRRLACEATVAIGVDDDVGHTLYEGRARRSPNPAQRREVLRRDRHCRFPGCAHVTFTNVHHVVAWKPGGRTDLDNLALLCVHHHHLVHSKGWEMTGNANGELCFVGPTGRVMTSRPSPRWGVV